MQIHPVAGATPGLLDSGYSAEMEPRPWKFQPDSTGDASDKPSGQRRRKETHQLLTQGLLCSICSIPSLHQTLAILYRQKDPALQWRSQTGILCKHQPHRRQHCLQRRAWERVARAGVCMKNKLCNKLMIDHHFLDENDHLGVYPIFRQTHIAQYHFLPKPAKGLAFSI